MSGKNATLFFAVPYYTRENQERNRFHKGNTKQIAGMIFQTRSSKSQEIKYACHKQMQQAQKLQI